MIRHRKDWGAVFLLDDRFLNQAQSSQLSSWVRPYYKKFQSFNAALVQFRGFLTTAMTDKRLQLNQLDENAAATDTAPKSMPMMVHVNPKVSINVPRDALQNEDELKRVVTISERDLAEEAANNFIDPEFLMTQPSETLPAGSNMPRSSSSTTMIKKAAPSTGTNLTSIISSLKNAAPAPKPQVPVAKFGLSAAKKDFEFAPPVKVVDLTDENENTDKSTDRPSASSNISQSQSSLSQLDSSSSKTKARFGLSASQASVPSVSSVLPSQSVMTSSDAVKSVLGK